MAVSQELHNVVCMNTGRVPACCRSFNFPSPFDQQQTSIVAAAPGTKGWDWMSTRVTTSIIRQWNCLGDHQMILWSRWCSGGILLKLLQCLRIESAFLQTFTGHLFCLKCKQKLVLWYNYSSLLTTDYCYMGVHAPKCLMICAVSITEYLLVYLHLHNTECWTEMLKYSCFLYVATSIVMILTVIMDCNIIKACLFPVVVSNMVLLATI